MAGADWLKEAVRAAVGSSAAAVTWRHRGKLHLTVIVKATFTFASDGPMPRAAAQRPILWADAHHRGSPAASVRLPADVAPRVPRAQVVVAGHACSVAGPATSLTVRLGLFSGTRSVLHKELVVKDSSPFTRIPLVYERAYGGFGVDENPLGLGAGGEAQGPTILHPTDPARAAGLGVVGASWPARRRRLGSTPRSALEAPVADVPEAFDWDYFQAVPPDQEIDRILGDEWIVLEGLSPSAIRLRTCLPRARAEARLFGLGGRGIPEGASLSLPADTLVLDTDAQECSVVFRNHFELPAEEALSAVAVTAGVETFDTPIAWPEAPLSRGRSMPVAEARPLTRDTEKTAVLASEATFALAAEDIEVVSDAPAPAEKVSTTATIAAMPPSAMSTPLPFLDAMGPSALARPSGPPSERSAGTGTLAASITDLYPGGVPGSPLPTPGMVGTPAAPAIAAPAIAAPTTAAPTFMRSTAPVAEAPPPEPAPGPPPPPPASLGAIPGVVPSKPAAPAAAAPATADVAPPAAAAAPAPPPAAAAPRPKPPKPVARQKPRPPRPGVPRPPASVKTGLYGGFGSDGA